MFTTVENLATDALIVEDTDGIRLLIVEQPRLRPAHFDRCVEEDVAAMLLVTDVGWGWAKFDTEDFSKPRDGWVVPHVDWQRIDEPMPYRGLLGTVEVIEPSSFVHLHAHAEYSALDGVSKISEMADAAVADGQTALAVTDHGTCAGHPDLQIECQKRGLRPIFGQEANFVLDRHIREDTSDYYHLVLLAQSNTGLHNLWAASTEANRTGFYKRPRMDWEILERYSEGLIATTACLRGPLSRAILDGNDDVWKQRLSRLMQIFEGRLYVELHTNNLPDQIALNHRLVEIAEEFSLPTIVVTDSHYPCADDRLAHEVWIAAQTNNDLTDDTGLFEGKQDYHFMTEGEVRKALDYLPDEVVEKSILNTQRIAESCDAEIERIDDPPVFSVKHGPQRDVERLVDLCMEGWVHRGLPTEGAAYEEYAERFDIEMQLLVSKGFCGYFLIVSDYAIWAKDRGILVGPGRGSGGGSLVAYLSRITEIDPIAADLMFERFLNPGRDSLPDFDLDFPSSKRGELEEFLIERYGVERVVRIGSHLRMKNKGVIRDLARVFKETLDIDYADIDVWSNTVEDLERDTAGLGLPWEDLWERDDGTLHAIRARYPEMFEIADKVVGRLKSYGKHAAGFVVSTEGTLSDKIPQRNAGNADDVVMVSEWDMNALESFGHVKLDLLTIRNLDTIQLTVDLIKERTGEMITPYDWGDKEYDDPATWEMLSEGSTLGVFQVETSTGTDMCKRLQPQSLTDLAAVVTLVRPGPMKSGLTDTFLRRRFGQEQVEYPHESLEEALGRTYGAMIYQEDIMAVCQILGGYSLGQADDVRRILGKKKVDKVEEEGHKFLAGCEERGIDRKMASALWDQMAMFAQYSFNRAHAWGYAMIAHWCAYLKRNYEVAFIAAALSTIDKDRIPDFVREARRLGIEVLPPDINESREGFVATDRAVRYGFSSLKGIGDATTYEILEHQPYESFDQFRDIAVHPKGTKVDRGNVELLASVGAFDSLIPNRRALEMRLEHERAGLDSKCVFKDEEHENEHGLPCHYRWDMEPPVIGRSGKPLKPKPVPKRCTKACRQYRPPEPFDASDVAPYTAREVREREKDLLGVYLSSTPFDDLGGDLSDLSMMREVEERMEGTHYVVGLLHKVKRHVDRTNRTMAFLGGEDAEGTPFDIVVFAKTWEKYKGDLKVNRLALMRIAKTERGIHLLEATGL